MNQFLNIVTIQLMKNNYYFASEIRNLSSDIGFSESQLIVTYLLKFEFIDIAIIGTKYLSDAALLATLGSINDIDILNQISNLIKKIL